MENVVKSLTEGYGYKYASLSDLAKQGVNIPKMKTGTDEGREYIYCYDNDLREWVRGAEIVVPNAKGLNAAQLYGSALSYARRYSVLMLCGLACDDDNAIENISDDGSMKSDQPKKKQESKPAEKPADNPVDYREMLVRECERLKMDVNEVARRYNLSRQTKYERYKEVYEELCKIV